jgi:hypothetical protein
MVLQVQAARKECRQAERRQFARHGTFPCLLLPVYSFRCCSECWCTVQKIDDGKRYAQALDKFYIADHKIVPFVVTIVVTLLMSLYMLLDPAEWLSNFMDLTEMSLDFKWILLVLAGFGFAIAYLAERHIFPTMAKYIGRLKRLLWPSHEKKRKRYKKILEGMID